MNKNILPPGGLAALVLTLASSLPAFADGTADNPRDHLSISGYAVGSYMNYNPSAGPSVDSLFDASKPVPGGGSANAVLTRFTVDYQPVTAVVSFNYSPNAATSELTVLDAYVTYGLGDGLSLTGGKFLSYMGYESFYPTNMDQISYANGDFLAPIPGYHTGLRLDYAKGTTSAGVAVVDSAYSPFGGTRGDGELSDNAGFETFVSYTGIPHTTLWAGLVYDTAGGFQAHDVVMFDVWASYQLTKRTRVAAEFVTKDGGFGAQGTNWIGFLNHSFTDRFSSTFRVSGENMADGGPDFVKYTVAPGVALNANLTVRVEYSYYDYSGFATKRANFFGIQGLFKF